MRVFERGAGKAVEELPNGIQHPPDADQGDGRAEAVSDVIGGSDLDSERLFGAFLAPCPDREECDPAGFAHACKDEG